MLVSGEYSPASDVYGWAMTMAELLTANLPFADRQEERKAQDKTYLLTFVHFYSPITFMTQLEEAIVDGLRPILPKATPLVCTNILQYLAFA